MPIERETKFERPTTVADLLKLYRTRYVEVEPLNSVAGHAESTERPQCSTRHPAGDGAQRPDAIEDFKAR